MSMAMRERSRRRSHCSLRCSVSLATNHTQAARGTSQAVRTSAWNHAVCQKKTLIGKRTGILLTFSGLVHQGLPPKGASTTALDQSVFATLIVFQYFIILRLVRASLNHAVCLPRK